MSSAKLQLRGSNALRRPQAMRRREVLDTQMEIQLAAQPLMLDVRSFKRAERLAIQHRDQDLRRFLRGRTRHLVQHWIRFFNRSGRRGRPRSDREALDALTLHAAGASWSDIGRKQQKSKDAARKLAKSR